MKFIVFLGLVLLILACGGSRKPELYRYPPSMPREKRAEFVAYCDKGRVLYGLYCSKCHSKFVNGKELIPDFTPIQLDTYDMRQGLTNHEDAISDRKIPEDEMDMILFFLGHKKTNKELAGEKSPKKKL